MNPVKLPVSRDQQVRRIASVCDMHRVPFGSAQSLKGFLSVLDENKHLAMDFWAIIANLSDEQAGVPSGRSLNGWMLEIIVEGVTGSTVAEVMALGGEPRQAVGHLASLLAGEDAERPAEFGPPPPDGPDEPSEKSGATPIEVAGPTLVPPEIDPLFAELEEPENHQPYSSHSKPPASKSSSKTAEAAGRESSARRARAFSSESASRAAALPLKAEPVADAPMRSDIMQSDIDQLSLDLSPAVPAAASDPPEVVEKRRAFWNWADSVTQETARPGARSGTRASYIPEAEILEPHAPEPQPLESKPAIVGEVVPEVRRSPSDSGQTSVPVAVQVSFPGSVPITFQVSLPTASTDLPEIGRAGFSASGFRQKLIAEQNAHLLTEQLIAAQLAAAEAPAAPGSGSHAKAGRSSGFRPVQALFEGYGEEERSSRRIWLVAIMLSLGAVLGLVVAKNHQSLTWQGFQAAMREKYGAALWQPPQEAGNPESNEASNQALNQASGLTPALTNPTPAPAPGTAPSGQPVPSAPNQPRSGSARSGPRGARPTVTVLDEFTTANAASSRGAVPVDGAVMTANLISSQVPVYPEEARANGVEGRVVLRATILKSGAVGHLHVLEGDPSLRIAALEAVSKWKYRPYWVNGEPVDVVTTITLNFRMNQ